MLHTLVIENTVLVKSLNLVFQKGLNVLTGETGAGKSVLLSALGLVCGNRGNSNLIGNFSNKAFVCASFDVDFTHPVWDILSDINPHVDKSEIIILKRSINTEGKSLASINNIPVNIRDLRIVGDSLVDVQGQFDQQGLLNPAQHANILDTFAEVNSQKKELSSLYASWQQNITIYENAVKKVQQAKQDAEYVQHCLRELEVANPKAGEEQELYEKKLRLQNAEKLLRAYDKAYAILAGDAGIDESVRTLERTLHAVADKGGEDLGNILTTTALVAENTQVIIDSIKTLAQDIQDSVGDLNAIEERLFLLKDLARKHRVAIEQLPSILEDFRAKSTLIDNSDDTLNTLQKKVKNVRGAYIKLAQEVSGVRNGCALTLAEKINAEMIKLGLEKAKFAVRVETQDIDIQSEDVMDIGTVFTSGIDAVCFTARMNVGGHFNPIHKCASGGELSRMLLAINVVLAKSHTTTTLFFDEVDTGVGGKAAANIGKCLQTLAKSRQTFVITHSPQVAVAGQHHFLVEKFAEKNTAVTKIGALDLQQRIREIARMVSGVHITDVAIANAKTLLGVENA